MYEALAILLIIILFAALVRSDKGDDLTEHSVVPIERELRRLYFIRGKTRYSIVKIGYTSRLDERRLMELERHVGFKLELVAEFKCNYAWDLEQAVHSSLQRTKFVKSLHRKYGNEWYRIPAGGIASIFLCVEQIAGKMKKSRRDFCFEVVFHKKVLRDRMPLAREKLAVLRKEKGDSPHDPKFLFYFEQTFEHQPRVSLPTQTDIIAAP